MITHRNKGRNQLTETDFEEESSETIKKLSEYRKLMQEGYISHDMLVKLSNALCPGIGNLQHDVHSSEPNRPSSKTETAFRVFQTRKTKPTYE